MERQPPPIPSLEEVLEQEELQRRRTNQAHRILTSSEVNALKQKLRAASYHHGGSDLAHLFEASDKDRSGHLDLQELSALVKKLIPHVTREEMKHLFDTLDADKSGAIDKNEFIAFVTGKSDTAASSSSFDTNSTSTNQALVGITNYPTKGSGSPKPMPSSQSRDSLSSTEGGTSQGHRQPAASARKLQQAYHEKELLLQEVVNLKEQLRKVQGQRNYGNGAVGKVTKISENNTRNDPKIELVINANVKLGTSVCMWCIKYLVLKMKSQAFKQWCVMTTEARVDEVGQLSPSFDKEASVEGRLSLLSKNGGVSGSFSSPPSSSSKKDRDGDMDKKRRELLASAKNIVDGKRRIGINYDEDEMFRRLSNQTHIHMTSVELENMKHKIIAASYNLGRADLKTFFDRIDKDRSGTVDLPELMHAIKKLVPSITRQQMVHLFHLMDTNGNGVIERSEFIAFMTNRQSPVTKTPRSPRSPKSSPNRHQLLSHDQIHAHSMEVATRFSPQTTTSQFYHMEAPTQSYLNSQYVAPNTGTRHTSPTKNNDYDNGSHNRKVSTGTNNLDRLVVPTSASLKKLNAKVITNASDNFFISETPSNDSVDIQGDKDSLETSLVPDIREAIKEIKSLTDENSHVDTLPVNEKLCPLTDGRAPSATTTTALDRNVIASLTTEDYLSPSEDTKESSSDPLPGNKKKTKSNISHTSALNSRARINTSTPKSFNTEISDEKEELRRKSGQTHVNLTSKESELLKHRIIAASYRLGKADLGGLFDRMDRDHNGTIDADELAFGIKRLLPTVTKFQLIHLLESIDEDRSGTISKEEFIEFLSHRKSQENVYQNVAYGKAGYINPHQRLVGKKIEKAQLKLLQGPPLPTKVSPKFKFKGLL